MHLGTGISHWIYLDRLHCGGLETHALMQRLACWMGLCVVHRWRAITIDMKPS